MTMLESKITPSILEIDKVAYANFNKASLLHYDGQNFEELATNSPIDAVSLVSFYTTQISKNAIMSLDLEGKVLTNTRDDGREATINSAKRLVPGYNNNESLQRRIWNNDLVVSVVKHGILGRRKQIKTITIPLSKIPVND